MNNKKLGIKQINNLRAGNTLSVELDNQTPNIRTFISLGAYQISQGLGGSSLSSRYLNASWDDVVFWLRKYDINDFYIKNNIYITDKELENSEHIKSIPTLLELENKLLKYIDDLSILDIETKYDNPL